MSEHIDTTRPVDGLPPMPLPTVPPLDGWSRALIGCGGLAMACIVVIIGFVIYATVTMPVAVEEDSPGWDCATMGNRICGHPVLAPVHPTTPRI